MGCGSVSEVCPLIFATTFYFAAHPRRYFTRSLFDHSGHSIAAVSAATVSRHCVAQVETNDLGETEHGHGGQEGRKEMQWMENQTTDMRRVPIRQTSWGRHVPMFYLRLQCYPSFLQEMSIALGDLHLALLMVEYLKLWRIYSLAQVG